MNDQHDTEDTLDMPLTVKDIEEMDPMMVLSMYNKVRQSRNDLKIERDQVRENLGERNKELGNLHAATRQMQNELVRKNGYLAEVAERFIQQGALAALMLAVKEDGK